MKLWTLHKKDYMRWTQARLLDTQAHVSFPVALLGVCGVDSESERLNTIQLWLDAQITHNLQQQTDLNSSTQTSPCHILT